jgi:hypothetical protein
VTAIINEDCHVISRHSKRIPGTDCNSIIYSYSSQVYHTKTVASNWKLNGLYRFMESLKFSKIFVPGRVYLRSLLPVLYRKTKNILNPFKHKWLLYIPTGLPEKISTLCSKSAFVYFVMYLRKSSDFFYVWLFGAYSCEGVFTVRYELTTQILYRLIFISNG